MFAIGYEGGYHELEESLLRVAWTFLNRFLDDDDWFYGPHWESETGAAGAAESVVIDRPGWPRHLYSPTETAPRWGGGTQHAAR